ncbi:hypothetical protein ARMSODRAFT_977275 [Armillaria solidipes]|uniref:Uncharacterized protein n=1 Tax=Armillaria solidipes TaxID=1076256 RepID=A0A2H3BAJ4_9AGAR|nr:hypothetical protein ARMSODRAFT_977275 [Armillaria solidipes]
MDHIVNQDTPLWRLGAALSLSRDKQSFLAPRIRKTPVIPLYKHITKRVEHTDIRRASPSKQTYVTLVHGGFPSTLGFPIASMPSPSPAKSQDVLPNFELPTASNVSLRQFSEYAQRTHLAPASNIDLLWDTMSANQIHQFVAVSGPQDAGTQIRENPFPPVDADAKRSTSCPPPPPPPTSMPSRDASKCRDDYGLALYGPPRSETEAKSFAWAIDPSTAPALTTGAYRIDTPGCFLLSARHAPTPRKFEELVWS